MSNENDAHAQFRKALRNEGVRISPWRLGVAVGKAGSYLPSPYNTQKFSNCYMNGVEYGREKQQNIKEPS